MPTSKVPIKQFVRPIGVYSTLRNAREVEVTSKVPNASCCSNPNTLCPQCKARAVRDSSSNRGRSNVNNGRPKFTRPIEVYTGLRNARVVG